MDFPIFPNSTSYIFPQVNATTGGQLISEYNLRFRESVGADPNVPYEIGLSYAHSMADFEVSKQEDSSTVLKISAGRAVVNGHGFKSVTDVAIDLAKVNSDIQIANSNSDIDDDMLPLTGALTIGLRAFYSAEPQTSGTLSVDSTSAYNVGIQLVIYPQGYVKLPSNADNLGDVNMHLKLADFTFINGAIGENISNNPDKIRIYSADRIGGSTSQENESTSSTATLNSQNLYIMRGDGTWCVANGSLMVWDANGVPAEIERPTTQEATFMRNAETGGVDLVVPHKQIDGLKTIDNVPLYFADRRISLPIADYVAGTAGIVDRNYTEYIKTAVDQLNNIYKSTNGKQVWYIDTLNSIKDLPKIQEGWQTGDYVLVREDNTVMLYAADTTQAPSTLYVVLNGTVKSVSNFDADEQRIVEPPEDGTQLGETYTDEYNLWEQSIIDNQSIQWWKSWGYYDEGWLPTDTSDIWNLDDWVGEVGSDYFKYVVKSYKYDSLSGEATAPAWKYNTYYRSDEDTDYAPITGIPRAPIYKANTYYEWDVEQNIYKPLTQEPTNWGENYTNYYIRSYTLVDSKPDRWSEDWLTIRDKYFTRSIDADESDSYYYVVKTTNTREYSQPIYLTGTISLAQDSLIGGFYNASEAMSDAGYVILDSDGHLRLLDYGLLRSGTLAYQLGADFESPAGIDNEEVQNNLDEYVNNRVAFPNVYQATNSDNARVINIVLNLSQSDTETNLYIDNIDSRFGTSIYLHIRGNADNNTIINIVNCEKIRIDNNIGGTPVINLDNSNLYYDSTVLSYLSTVQDLKLWYEKFSSTDLNIIVDGLTVTAESVEDTNPIHISLNSDSNNTHFDGDNHIQYSLHGVTFDPSGSIIGMSIYLGSNITAGSTDSTRNLYVKSFDIVSSTGFSFPISKLINQIKISGVNTNVYGAGANKSEYYIVTDTKFSAITPTYNGVTTDGGIIGIEVSTYTVPTITVDSDIAFEQGVIPCWKSDTMQVYEGYLYGIKSST